MNRISKLVVALTGWGLIAGLMYVCACLSLFVVVALIDRPISIFPLDHYQAFQYEHFRRNIWQHDDNCVQLDSELIYKPREGACHFTNLEFDTTLNFDANGRRVPARDQIDLSLPGIAVLGDSHAMGWGVEDEETFANVMQSRLTRPVYNLGVSSYGTERELKRLALSGLADKVDTIVILYCDNDIAENMALRTPEEYAESVRWYAEEKQLDVAHMPLHEQIDLLNSFLDVVLVAPIELPLRRLLNRPEYIAPEYYDFQRHLDPLRLALLRYEGLLANKRVYIAYVTTDGFRFTSYPNGTDAVLPNVTFLDMPWQPEDFLPLDRHISAPGHRRFGEWLVAALHENPDRQP